MSTWRSLETDFRTIQDLNGDLRADWSHQESIPNAWRLAGGALRESGDRFEAVAKLAGIALLSDPVIITILPEEVIREKDPLKRWLTAVRLMTNRFESGPFLTLLDPSDQPAGHILTGSVPRVIDASALLCLNLEVKKATDPQVSTGIRVYIDGIDSFSRVSEVQQETVADLLDSDGRVDLWEDDIQKALEEILCVPFHRKDWGGEDNDLFTANVILGGRRISTAFALKGRGLKSTRLRIRDCGKNGDQIVRLIQTPAELFILQYVGEIDDSVLKDIEGKIRDLRAQGRQAWYCVLNGQDTARLLRAYGKL